MYQSDNAASGDNQQETAKWLEKIPDDIGNYISGFVDGEGSFNISIRRHPGYKLGWKTSLAFNVSQKGAKSLELLRRTFNCGYVRKRWDNLHYFEIVEFEKVVKYVLPFFSKYNLRSEKKKDFEIFQSVADLMKNGDHLTIAGITKILKLRAPMNYGGKNRRLKVKEILANLKGSSETIRRTPNKSVKI